MALLTLQQTSFTGGEWSPSMYGRYDIDQYHSANRTIKNFIPLAHGGVINRGGTYYIDEVINGGAAGYVRLIPFQYSKTQAYVLEFTHNAMRVIKDGAYVMDASVSITSTTSSNPVSVQATAHGLSSNDYVYISGVSGMTEINGRMFQITVTDANNFTLDNEDGTGYSAGTGGTAQRYYTLATNIDYWQLAYLYYSQKADQLYVVGTSNPDIAVNDNVVPYKLTRTSDTSWTITAVSFGSSVDAPTGLNRSSGTGTDNNYVVTATDVNGEESEPTSSVEAGDTDTISWTAPSGDIEFYTIYKDENKETGFYGWVADIEATNTSWTDDTISPDMTRTAPIAQTVFDSADDYPTVCTFFQQRMVYANSNNQPHTIWGSQTGYYDNFNKSHPVRDTDPYEFELDAIQMNAIKWMVPLDRLVVGTAGSEWQVSGGSSDAITPTDVKAVVQSNWGCHDMMPIVIGNTILFVQFGGNRIRYLSYSLEADSYDGMDLTIFARHLFEGYTIVSWAFQRNPYSVLWCVRDDGKLIGLTYLKEQKVLAWHQHETDGDYIDICSVPNSSGGDDLYVVVKRTKGTEDKYYLEQFVDRMPDDDIEQAFFVDSGLTYWDPKTITNITQAQPPVVTTSGSHGYSDGDLVDIRDVSGMTDVNGKRYKVDVLTSTTFELLEQETGADIDGTGFSEYTSGGTVAKAVTTVSGLTHLNGKEVVALANGNVETGLTVSSSAITLSNAASRIHVGLNYESVIETLDFIVANQTDSLYARHRNIVSVLMYLENTRAVWIGPSSDRLVEVAFRDDEDWGEAINLYSGYKEMIIPSGSQRQSRIYIKNTDPVPVCIVTLVPQIEIGGV